MLKGFVVVVIVFAVIGSIFFFCWDSHVGFGVITCWYVIKYFFFFFLVLFVTVWGYLVLVAFFFCLWVSRVASYSVCFL